MNKSAVIVEKRDAKRELELLKNERIYDDSRRIVVHEGGSIELPILGSGGKMKNRTIINQKNPQRRIRGLKDLLREPI